ncbi:unnamed protein product [Closterium sp. NIES-65]|nr:unnamed protein product [Closterium sp. NIES-65]
MTRLPTDQLCVCLAGGGEGRGSTPTLPHAPPLWPCRYLWGWEGGSTASRCHEGEYRGGLGLSSHANSLALTPPFLPPLPGHLASSEDCSGASAACFSLSHNQRSVPSSMPSPISFFASAFAPFPLKQCDWLVAPLCSRLANSLLALALSPFLPSLPTDQLCVCLAGGGEGRGSAPTLPHAPPLWPCRYPWGWEGGSTASRCHEGEYRGGLGLSRWRGGAGVNTDAPSRPSPVAVQVPVCGDGRGAALPVAATRESIGLGLASKGNMALCMVVVGRGKRHGVKGRVGRRWEHGSKWAGHSLRSSIL